MVEAGVNWAIEDEKTHQEDFDEKKQKVKEKLDFLPEIPEKFDIDTYEVPEPVLRKNADGTITKYSWEMICDPNQPDNEDPPMVIRQLVEVLRKEVKRVHKKVAARRKWAKYGQSADDGEGVSNQTTTMSTDDIPIEFKNSRHLQTEPNQVVLDHAEEEDLKKLRITVESQLRHNNLIGANVGKTMGQAPAGDSATGEVSFSQKIKQKMMTGGQGPGSRFDGPPGRGMRGMPGERGRDDGGLRVTNLSENITDGDIHDLFGQCGPIQRVYLARDKKTGKARGFAYVTFERKQDAETAIRTLHKYAYDHLILGVEWSKTDKDK